MYRNSQVWHQYIPDKHILILSLYSICPTPLNYQLEPTATVPPTPGLIACANGVLAKRQEGCPYMLNLTSPLNASISIANPASSPTSINPCPNAGYSCSECPDGWFCPPHPTPAQSCICGYGWACANCKDGYFCIPGPISTLDGLLNTISSLVASSKSSLITANTGSLITSAATLQSLGTAVAMATGTITCIDGSVVMEANDCLNGVPGTSSNVVGITIINEPMAADMANHLAVDAASSTTATTPSPAASTRLMAAVSFTVVLPTVTTTSIIPTATAIISNQPDSFKHAPNAAESMLNQLMNGVPAGIPVSSAPGGQLPQQTPALGLARGRRRV
jgi:hypothetical protein